MKKLTKALQGTIKKLEVKSLEQLKELATKDLNKNMNDLVKCYDYDMSEEQNETVETLIEDIKNILTDRLTSDLVLVADKKEAPKKTATTDKKTAPKKATNKKEAPKKEAPKADTKEEKEAPKTTKADKPKAPKATKTAPKKEAPKKEVKKTLKDVLKWKSLIKMTLDDNIHYVYVVDIEKDFQDVLCRSTDINTLVFQFTSDMLEAGTYTDPNNDTWKLEYTGQELK